MFIFLLFFWNKSQHFFIAVVFSLFVTTSLFGIPSSRPGEVLVGHHDRLMDGSGRGDSGRNSGDNSADFSAGNKGRTFLQTTTPSISESHL